VGGRTQQYASFITGEQVGGRTQQYASFMTTVTNMEHVN